MTHADNPLTALVIQHKPQEITLPNGEWGINCEKCDGWDWPCSTLKAIKQVFYNG